MRRYRHVFIILIVLLNNKEINSSDSSLSGFLDRARAAYEDARNHITRDRDILEQKKFQLYSQQYHFDREKEQIHQLVNPDDHIHLNMGGEKIVTRRRTLTKIPNSILAKIFDGTYQGAIALDSDRSYFLDYNPVLFTYLLDQLRTLRKNETAIFRPPPSSILIKPFNKMLRELGLPQPPRSENDIIALNVGGEKIVTLRKTLTGVPNSILARLASPSKEINRDRLGRPFLDYNPNLFHHLLDQLREGKQVDDINLDAPSNVNKDTYKAMLIGLRVPTTTTTSTTKSTQSSTQSTKKTHTPFSSSTLAKMKTVVSTKSPLKLNKKKSTRKTRPRLKRDVLSNWANNNFGSEN